MPMVLLMVVACTCQDRGEVPTGKPASSIGHTVPQPVGTSGPKKRTRTPKPPVPSTPWGWDINGYHSTVYDY